MHTPIGSISFKKANHFLTHLDGLQLVSQIQEQLYNVDMLNNDSNYDYVWCNQPVELLKEIET